MLKLRKTIIAGLLLASSIVLSRFLSIHTPIVKIGFSFIPRILSAMLLGPWWTILISGLNDLIGALMFPTGAYFVGYTITAIVGGVIYGFLLNKAYNMTNKKFLLRLILACLLVSIVCNLCLNTLWIYVTTKKAVAIITPTRIIKESILLPIKIVIMQGLHFTLLKTGLYKKILKDNFLTIQENQNSSEEVTANEEKND